MESEAWGQPLWQDQLATDRRFAIRYALVSGAIAALVLLLGAMAASLGDVLFGFLMAGLAVAMVSTGALMWRRQKASGGFSVGEQGVVVPAVGGLLLYRIKARTRIPRNRLKSYRLAALGPQFRYRWSLVMELVDGQSVNTHIEAESIEGLRRALESIGIPERPADRAIEARSR